MLDSSFQVATPEGIELRLRLAGPVPRALAWTVDFGWRLALLLALSMFLIPLGDAGVGVLLLIWFVLEWLVPAWFEATWGGATPGKKLLGLMVVQDSGAPCSLRQALTRNLLRFADFLPMLYLGGLLSMLLNARFKRLGDFVAGTVVVYAEQAAPARAIPIAEPRRPPQALGLDEARAVLDFAERARELGAARADELAQLAAPMLEDAGSSPTEALIEIANHLRGGQAEHASA